jgi:uncharacterized protein (DUF2249 family)
MDHEQQTLPVIDVRTIIPRDRHPLIFQTFDSLQPGASFMLVNDHEREKQFTWRYLEEGPEVWRAQIGKVEAA